MSLWNFWKKDKRRMVAILDIGTGSVSAAIVAVTTDKNHPPLQLIAHTQAEIKSPGQFDYDRFNHEVTKAIHDSLNSLLKESRLVPEEYVCFLASPYVVTQTKLIDYATEQPEVFTKKILDGLSRRTITDFKEICSDQMGELAILDNQVMKIKLDGYEMVRPFGLRASQVSIAQFLSASPVRALEKLKHDIIAVSHHDRISFHSSQFAAWHSLRNLLSGDDRFIAIDVSGELSDVLVSSDGILEEQASFPYGLKAIIRDLAVTLGTVPAEASSLLTLFLNGHLHNESKRRVEQALIIVRDRWIGNVLTTLELTLGGKVVPETLLITGDTIAESLFIGWLKSEHFSRFTFSQQNFRVKYYDYRHLAEQLGAPRTIHDTYILLETGFCEKSIAKSP